MRKDTYVNGALVSLFAEIFRSFFAETFWSPRRFGHLSDSCTKLAVTVPIGLCFQTFWSKWLNFFRSFQKCFGLWPKKINMEVRGI